MPATKLQRRAGVRSKTGLCAKLRNSNSKLWSISELSQARGIRDVILGLQFQRLGLVMGGVRLPYNVQKIELRGFESDGPGPGMGGEV